MPVVLAVPSGLAHSRVLAEASKSDGATATAAAAPKAQAHPAVCTTVGSVRPESETRIGSDRFSGTARGRTSFTPKVWNWADELLEYCRPLSATWLGLGLGLK